MRTSAIIALYGAVAVSNASTLCGSLLPSNLPQATSVPWCKVLSQCSAGVALISVAVNCSASEVGSTPSKQHMDVEKLCGQRRCTNALKALFEASVSMPQWVEAAQSALSKGPSSPTAKQSRGLAEDPSKQDINILGLTTKQKSAYLTSSASTLGEAVEAHLRKCLADAAVEESQLELPMSISLMTGSGKFLSAQPRSAHQCSEMRLWMDAKLAYYVGYNYATSQLLHDTAYSVALVALTFLLVANATCVAVACMYKHASYGCIRQICPWFAARLVALRCCPASVEREQGCPRSSCCPSMCL